MNGKYYLMLLRGTGDGHFVYMNDAWGITDVCPCSIDGGLAFGDIDGDGDLDIAGYANLDEPYQVKLYRNDNPAQNWLNVRPIGQSRQSRRGRREDPALCLGNAAARRLRIGRDLLLPGCARATTAEQSPSAISGSARGTVSTSRSSSIRPDASCANPRRMPTRRSKCARTAISFLRTGSSSSRDGSDQLTAPGNAHRGRLDYSDRAMDRAISSASATAPSIASCVAVRSE